MCGRKDGPYFKFFLDFMNTNFVEVSDSGIFKITEIDGVIDVPKSIHITPNYILLKDYGVFVK
jgi:hypothetical protein